MLRARVRLLPNRQGAKQLTHCPGPSVGWNRQGIPQQLPHTTKGRRPCSLCSGRAQATTRGRGRRADQSCPASQNKLADDGRDRPRSRRCTTLRQRLTTGEVGPDRCEGARVTATHLPRLEEEDHDPCSHPPQTIAGEEEDVVKVTQVDTDLGVGQRSWGEDNLGWLIGSIFLRSFKD
jgi:hypothetical protein